MTAHITVPWIDPLAIIDPAIRLVIAFDNTDLAVLAKLTPVATLPRGATRTAWLNAFGVSEPTDFGVSAPTDHPDGPVVTFVPAYHASSDRLVWQTLRLKHFPLWLKQLAEGSVHPDPLVLLPQLDAHRTEVGRLIARDNDHSRHGLTWLRGLLHRVSHPEDQPARAASFGNLTREAIALLLTFETASAVPAMIPHAQGGGVVGHHPSTNAVGRSRWRRNQSHGWKPDQAFYGKSRWGAERAGPGTLYCGVELEMDLPSIRARETTRRALFVVADELGVPNTSFGGKERMHLETDGSLGEYGLEIVLMPHEVHSAQAEHFWRQMYRSAIALGANNQRGRAGMHIHASAAAALRPMSFPLLSGQPTPTEADQRETIALLIDLITAMLAGGPELWHFQPTGSGRPEYGARHGMSATPQEDPYAWASAQTRVHREAVNLFEMEAIAPNAPTSELPAAARVTPQERLHPEGWHNERGNRAPRAACLLFGRPDTWSGTYAVPSFILFNPTPGLTMFERYRHVNWNNRSTIEFRIFGPQGFDASIDWINVCTQLVSAIVEVARTQALAVLYAGCAATVDQQATSSRFIQSLPTWLQPMLRKLNASWAVRVDGPNRPWLIGTGTPPNTGDFSRMVTGAQTLMDARTTAGTEARHAEVFLAVHELWRVLIQHLDDQAPRFDILREYIAEKIKPHLPVLSQVDGLLRTARGPAAPVPPPTNRPRATIGQVHGTMNALSGELTMDDLSQLQRAAYSRAAARPPRGENINIQRLEQVWEGRTRAEWLAHGLEACASAPTPGGCAARVRAFTQGANVAGVTPIITAGEMVDLIAPRRIELGLRPMTIAHVVPPVEVDMRGDDGELPIANPPPRRVRTRRRSTDST